ncbi:MAG: hypothetical protein IKX86_01845 [Clostridia bacterium]|nr:hypothetical protein [Clostridia bacterium]
MKKTALILCLIILLAGCSSGMRIPDDEAMEVINGLLPLSNEVNEIIFGKGLPAVDEAYESEHTGTAYYPVKEGTGYSSIADIKRAAEKVYSRSYLDAVYKTAFEGVSGGDSVLGSLSPRYTEIAGVLKVNVSAEGFDIRSYEKVTECRYASSGKGYAIYACKALASDGKTYDIKIYLTEQSGEWRLDSPTY